jgi:hypothetical protein
MQQSQVVALDHGGGGATSWAYRYRVGGRGSRRVQDSGFSTEQAARQALGRVLERLRQEQASSRPRR